MNLRRTLAGLLYPPKCPFCARVLDGREDALCPRCRSALPRTGPGDVRTVDGCAVCLAPLWYEGRVRDAVHRYKFRGGQNHAAVFGTLMAACLLTRAGRELDAVTWAPLSKKRLRRRGYDQARLLAERVGELLGRPVVPLLEKWRDTPPQSGLEDARRRRENVRGAYRLLPEARSLCSGKKLLLVDDVVTTGATMGECAKLLKSAGAASVAALSLAWARK